MSKQLLPIRDFLVVEKTKDAEKISPAGLVLTGFSDNEKIGSGKVLAVGSGTVTSDGKVIPLEVKVGDTVFFLKSLSVDLKTDGQEVLMLREEHVFCRTQN